MDRLFRELDINGDGHVTVDEFIEGMAKLGALSLFTKMKNEGSKEFSEE